MSSYSSSSAASTASIAATSTTASPSTPSSSSSTTLPYFRHRLILQGLPGSGKRTFSSLLRLPSSHVLTIPTPFLTSPLIYSPDIRHANSPSPGDTNYDHDLFEKDTSLGGRGMIYAKWAVVARSYYAVVVTVDARERAKLGCVAQAKEKQEIQENIKSGNSIITTVTSYFSSTYIDADVNGFASKSASQQSKIRSTLESQLTVATLLSSLLAMDRLRELPILIVVTHADCQDAMSLESIVSTLSLPTLLVDRIWRVATCDARNGDGLSESIVWLKHEIGKRLSWSEKATEWCSETVEGMWNIFSSVSSESSSSSSSSSNETESTASKQKTVLSTSASSIA